MTFTQLKLAIKRLFRRTMEWFGCERFSRPAWYDIDRKLQNFLPNRPGFFIETGAHNGYALSNTYFLERFKGWKGIMIEAVPEHAAECRKERKKSMVFNCALVADNYNKDHIEIYDASLMSVIPGAMEKEKEHLEKAAQFERNLSLALIKVKARTLTSILEECNIQKIDFFSLDVEGYELEVLKGLDFERYQPEFILVEANNREAITEYLRSRYTIVGELSHCDILFQRSTPSDI